MLTRPKNNKQRSSCHATCHVSKHASKEATQCQGKSCNHCNQAGDRRRTVTAQAGKWRCEKKQAWGTAGAPPAPGTFWATRQLLVAFQDAWGMLTRSPDTTGRFLRRIRENVVLQNISQQTQGYPRAIFWTWYFSRRFFMVGILQLWSCLFCG